VKVKKQVKQKVGSPVSPASWQKVEWVREVVPVGKKLHFSRVNNFKGKCHKTLEGTRFVPFQSTTGGSRSSSN